MPSSEANNNLAYHAARLLLLISLCGKPRSSKANVMPGIEGRTLLAKIDFFLRYPAYLRKASEILGDNLSNEDLGLTSDAETRSVEARMVRYLYGPWDHVYYAVLAYLIGKELITIERKRGIEVFRITSKGQDVARQLAQDPAYSDLAQRANAAYRLFNNYTGTRLKEFIYRYFPEVVNREIGVTI